MNLLLIAALLGQDVERIDCGTTAGWTLTDFAGGKPEGATLTADKALTLTYRRKVLTPLVHSVSLTEFQELRLTLRSTVDGLFLVLLQDRDGASFHHPFTLKAGAITTVRLTPAGFRLNDDSKVKKAALDPKRVGTGYCLLDSGALLGAKGDNRLTIQTVEIARSPLNVLDRQTIDGDIEITRSTVCQGDLFIAKGGRLKITAPRFVLRGNLCVQDATLEVEGTALSIPQRFNHQRGMVLAGRARLLLRNAYVATGVPIGLAMRDTSELSVDTVEFAGGLTCEVQEGCRVSLRKATAPGEFIIAPGGKVAVEETVHVLLWFALGPEAKDGLSWPAGAEVKDFSFRQVRVRDSKNVLWGIISAPGSACSVENSNLLACGFLLTGESQVVFRDLRNKRELDDEVIDRRIRFVRSTVGAWNFYPSQKTRLVVERCTFGEIIAFQEARAEVRDSICDGSGGYVAAHNRSELRLVRCRISCLVVAREDATVILEDCDVSGDIHAADRATVRIVNTRISGHVDMDPGAVIERTAAPPAPRPDIHARPFYMAMTPFPFDLFASGETYRTLAQYTDLIAHRFDEGIPWDTRLSEQVERDLQTRLEGSRGKKVYLSVTPLNLARDGLALHWGTEPHQERPGKWAAKDLDDPEVIDRYLAWCRDLIRRFRPEYVTYAIDVNVLAKKNATAWTKLMSLIKKVYPALKSDFPTIPFSLSIQLEEYLLGGKDQEEAVKQILPYTDMLCVSLYPYLLHEDPARSARELIARASAIAPDKPLAVSETGYPAEELELAGQKRKGSETWQDEYLRILLEDCRKHSAKFVVWLIPRDYDRLWELIKHNGAPVELFKLRRDTGLLDGNGKPRRALQTWAQWLKLPRR